MQLALALMLSVATGAAGAPGLRGEDPAALHVISRGKIVELEEYLVPEIATLVLFARPNSSVERAFLADLQKGAGTMAGIRLVELTTGMEPIAARYEVKETPTALVFDRRKRLVARSSDPEAIRDALKKAAGVMRIDWTEEGDANYEASVRLLGRPPGSGILRTMSLQPEYLKYINDLSMKAHFSDGYLPRRTKEMIATYVSQLNRCKY